MTHTIIYARFSPRPMNCQKCLGRMKKMVGLDAYECPGCGHTEALGNGEQGSIQAQLDRCREYCSTKRYQIGGEFFDEAVSGASLDRTGLDAAIEALKRDSVLVVYMMDRLSRGECIQWANIEQRIIDKKARYESASGEGTWGDSPQDKLMRTICRGLACFNREIGNIRTSESMLSYQKAGRRMTPSGKAPYGLMVDPDDPAKLVKNSQEQDTIRTIIATYQEVLQGSYRGKGYRELARRLDEMGIRSRSGGTIAHTLAADVIKRHACLNDPTKTNTPIR